jgi:hypothetical protein
MAEQLKKQRESPTGENIPFINKSTMFIHNFKSIHYVRISNAMRPFSTVEVCTLYKGLYWGVCVQQLMHEPHLQVCLFHRHLESRDTRPNNISFFFKDNRLSLFLVNFQLIPQTHKSAHHSTSGNVCNIGWPFFYFWNEEESLNI